MVKSAMKDTVIKRLIVLFSLMTSFGILIGMFISDILSGMYVDFTIALFDALAAGTFIIYVAIMEIFKEEFEGQKNTLLKFMFAASGLLLMALLALWL